MGGERQRLIGNHKVVIVGAGYVSSTVAYALARRTCGTGDATIAAKGRTHCGIATCVRQTANAVASRRPAVLCVSSSLMGELGCRGISLSAPSVVGPSGVQQRIRERWEPDEYRGSFCAV